MTEVRTVTREAWHYPSSAVSNYSSPTLWLTGWRRFFSGHTYECLRLLRISLRPVTFAMTMLVEILMVFTRCIHF